MNAVIEKHDHTGKYILDYPGTVLSRSATEVCVECFFDRDIAGEYMNISAGDRVVEWFFTDRWYNIMQFHDVRGGQLKGWYCNITRPTDIREDDGRLVIAWQDLALDVFVYPDGRIIVLDEDELAALNLPAHEVAQVWAAVDHLRALVKSRQPPFDRVMS